MTSLATGRRIRKATLTEIKEGEEWNWPDPGDIESDDSEIEVENEDELTTEQIFNNFDQLVQDWKSNLELVVSDALKRLKKTGKDKKLMIKYLPGEGSKREDLLNPVKEEIYTHWKREMKQTIKVTQKRLNKLNYDKILEISSLGMKSPAETPTHQPTSKDKVDLRALFKSMEGVYSSYNERLASRVPIYNLGGGMQNTLKGPAALPGMNPMCSMCNFMIEYPLRKAIKFQESEQDIMDILKDFTMDWRSTKKLAESWDKFNNNNKDVKANNKDVIKVKEVKMKEVKVKKHLKEVRRGSNPAQRMADRRDKRKYVMKEVEMNGEKRYFLIKRKPDQSSEDVADIFADWRDNLQKTRQRKPRTRKLSHRAERKQMLASVEKEAVTVGPKTYAEALKLNLREEPCVEDIFQSFTFYLKHLAKQKQTKFEDIGDIFFNFRHNFHVPASRPEDVDILASTTATLLNTNLDCGVATIKTIPVKEKAAKTPLPPKKSVRKLMKPMRTYTKEIVLMKKLHSPKPHKKQVVKPMVRDYTQEEIFSDFVPILNEPAATKSRQKFATLPVEYTQETIFASWLHNLDEVKLRRPRTVAAVPVAKKVPVVKVDYTCESYFADWRCLHLVEPVQVERAPAEPAPRSATPPSPKSPTAPTPKNSRKRQEEPKLHGGIIMMEDAFEDFKEDRRMDFNKVTKIKDKKRSQAERRSTGKRIK